MNLETNSEDIARRTLLKGQLQKLKEGCSDCAGSTCPHRTDNIVGLSLSFDNFCYGNNFQFCKLKPSVWVIETKVTAGRPGCACDDVCALEREGSGQTILFCTELVNTYEVCGTMTGKHCRCGQLKAFRFVSGTFWFVRNTVMMRSHGIPPLGDYIKAQDEHIFDSADSSDQSLVIPWEPCSTAQPETPQGIAGRPSLCASLI
ncbi:hypothetical protein J6590_040514 [Homalodisca vitripennis]|nr:hypothetical protein J6590_094722 [Homalodisca vitripennis]KAG8277509.1 hypothetical protein J6590_040514 [Homalodisca vitripennis]